MTSQLRLLVVPAYVLLVGLVCTAAVSFQLLRVVNQKDAERFEYVVAQTHDDIEDRIDTYVAMLEAGSSMLQAVDLDLSQAEFRAFAERLNLAERYPGVQGIGYSVRIRRGNENLIRGVMRAQGAPDFEFWPELPDRSRDRHAILYLEPLDERNQAAIGYDMYSEPTRQAAMELARDSGRPAASGAVELVQEITEEKQAGFLIYVPVYEAGDPGELEARREKLAGFVYSPFRADDLLDGIFGEAENPRLHLAIYDGAPGVGSLIHVSEGGETLFENGGRARFTGERALNVAGRPWTVAYATRPEFELSSSRQLAPMVLIAGVLVTLLLAAVAWWQARTYALARRRARELEMFNELGAALATERDLDRLLREVVEAGVELTEAESGAAFYRAPDSADGGFALRARTGDNFTGLARGEILAGSARDAAGFASADVTRLNDAADEGAGETAIRAPGAVRSYLAAPMTGRSGKVLGGLAFAHRKPGRFGPRTERLAAGLAAQAAIAVENARLWDETRSEMDHRKLLLEELNHRVKNTLATVQSMAAQTMRNTGSLQSFQERFQARLIALSGTHNLLTKGNWKGASLRELLEAELIPFEQEGAKRVTMEGPDVRLRPAEATSLGMAFHELTTNAVKYGALSRPEGRVEVRWTIQEQNGADRLRLEWSESGGPPVSPPTRRGFGSRLIERGLVSQHRGEAKMEFEPEGLRCRLELPLTAETQEKAA